MLAIFWGLNSKGLQYQRSENEKESCCLVFPSSTKREQTTTTAKKTSLKKGIRAASNFISLIPSRLSRQMLAIFWGLNSKGLQYQRSENEKESCCLVFPSSTKREQTTTTAKKTSLKMWIRAASNFIALIPSRLIHQMLAIFLGGLNSKGLCQSSGKEKESFCLVLTSSTISWT